MRIFARLPLHRPLHTSHPLLSKSLPPRVPLPDSDLIENFLKGSGPGGQKINKTSSAVQLKHIPTGIVVKYQDTRSREINRKMARRILQDRIEELQLGDEARTRVKAREKSKKKASKAKKARRKYRALEEGKAGVEGEDGEDAEGGDSDGGDVEKGEGNVEEDALEKGGDVAKVGG
ncbi:RF-1 domain containing protein [Pyrenophora tritici-repentis]|nr:RF-1 domain containing protein [Pyrenophora tritici-repentis]